jgi:hypothetical protein
VVFPIVSRRQRIVPEFSAKCFFTSLIVRERKEEEENNKKQFKQEKHKAQIVPAGMRTNPFLRSSSLVVLFFFSFLCCLRADPSGKRVHFSRAPPQSAEDEEEPENPQRKRKKKSHDGITENLFILFSVGTGRERGMNMNAANIS